MIENAARISAMFIPLIALAGVFIAWHQYYANRERVRLELYQRRLEIYRSLLDALNDLVDQAEGYQYRVPMSLDKAMDQAFFLVPPEVYKKIAPIRDRAEKTVQLAREASTLQSLLADGGAPDAETIQRLKEEYKHVSAQYAEEAPFFWNEARETLREAFRDVLSFHRF